MFKICWETYMIFVNTIHEWKYEIITQILKMLIKRIDATLNQQGNNALYTKNQWNKNKL